MLKKFAIDGYRGFKSLSLDGLSRVNVFVGKNNAGKSSLLEAFYLYGEKFSQDIFRRIAAKRGEMITDIGTDEFLSEISHFFHGHSFNVGSRFQMSSDAGCFEVVILPQGRSERYPFFVDRDGRLIRDRDGAALWLYVKKQQARANSWRTSSRTPLLPGGILPNRSPRFLHEMRTENIKDTCFISPDLMDFQMLVKMWNRIISVGNESDVIDALKILSPSVTSVQFLLTELSNYRYAPKSSAGILVGADNSPGRIPLGSLGDGMKRLLAIAMALQCAEGRCLYVDEIDVGFHYSVMSDIWRLVLEVATKKDIQVFVSTHSLDCLRGLANVCSTIKDDRLVSLYALHGHEEAVSYYSRDEIVRAVQNEVEVRS